MWVLNKDENVLVDVSKAIGFEIGNSKDAKNFYVLAYFPITEQDMNFRIHTVKSIAIENFETEKEAKIYLHYLKDNLKKQ